MLLLVWVRGLLMEMSAASTETTTGTWNGKRLVLLPQVALERGIQGLSRSLVFIWR